MVQEITNSREFWYKTHPGQDILGTRKKPRHETLGTRLTKFKTAQKNNSIVILATLVTQDLGTRFT